jgi:aspartyl-tRNA synthetase
MIQLVTLQDMRGFLNVNFQNGILNIYQRILIETKNETIINITANSEAQRKLIDDLINVDFVEIKPAQLPATNNDIEDELPFNDNTNNSI